MQDLVQRRAGAALPAGGQKPGLVPAELRSYDEAAMRGVQADIMNMQNDVENKIDSISEAFLGIFDYFAGALATEGGITASTGGNIYIAKASVSFRFGVNNGGVDSIGTLGYSAGSRGVEYSLGLSSGKRFQSVGVTAGSSVKETIYLRQFGEVIR